MPRDLEALEWRYKGEGAANIVVDYHGSDPALHGKVLRIRKTQSPVVVPLLSDKELELWEPWPSLTTATSSEVLLHAYVQDVMRPLLGDEFVDPGVPVPVSRRFLVTVSDQIRENRPAFRASASDIDFSSDSVLLVSDHTKFDAFPGDQTSTVAVEIKPKWGYLPTSHLIAPENAIKMRVPRFTMHQHLKYAQGKIKSISSYCPLDLFSETREGISKAVAALLETPQNNLRVFIDGDTVFSDETVADKHNLELSLAQLFAAAEGLRVAIFERLVTEVLYTSTVLKKLLLAQQEDQLDIEGMIHVFYSYLGERCGECSKFGDARPTAEAEIRRRAAVSQLHSDDTTMDKQKQLLRQFFTAATAKDCSLILTLKPELQQRDGADVVLCPTTGRKYVYKVALLDLDMKRLGKLPYYFALDQTIVKSFMNKGTERDADSAVP